MLHSPEVILAVCWQVRLSDGWYEMAEALYTYAWVANYKMFFGILCGKNTIKDYRNLYGIFSGIYCRKN